MINIEKMENIGRILIEFVGVQKKAKKMQFNPQVKRNKRRGVLMCVFVAKD